MFEYSKLRGKIREFFGTEKEFAKALGISKTSLSAKLNGHVEFTQSEIASSVVLLEIPHDSIHILFFNEKVKVS